MTVEAEKLSASFRIARNSAATFAAQLLSQGLRAVYVILVARYLSVQDFGFYSFALAICLVLTILSTLGMDTIVVRELASLVGDRASRDRRARTLYGSILTYEAILSLFVVGMLVLITHWRGYQGARQVAFLLLGSGLVFRQLGESLKGILRGYERMEYELVFGAVEGLGLVGLALLFQSLGFWFIGVFLAYALTYALQLLVGFCLVAYVFFTPSFARVRRDVALLGQAFPVGAARIASSFNTNSGPLLLPLLRTELEAGLYGAAYQPLKGLFLLTRSLGIGVLPVFSQLYSTGDDSALESSATSSLRYTTILVLPLTIGLFIFPDYALRLLYGVKYAEGAGVLRVLSLVILMTFLNTLLTNLLIAVRRQRFVGLGRGVSAAVNLGLLLGLTPRMGATGPAISLLSSELVLFLLFALYLAVSFRRLPLTRTMMRPMFASLFFALFLWIGRHGPLWMITSLGALIYVGALVLVGSLGKSDWARLVSLWHRFRSLVRRWRVSAKGKS